MAHKPLVIVESPAKAKTIGQLLGSQYKVMASVGHVVDLPSGDLAVDVEDDFRLTYEVTKKDVIRDLREALKSASELFLATDEDREGEAIAWHLKEQLKPKVPVRRMVFHEITRRAIDEAVRAPRDIDMGLVDAQEARRTLDRLYGYKVSRVLWFKVKNRLSAGRVQSPAIRLIVERERERMRFRSVSYWDVVAQHPTAPAFASTLTAIDGQRVATGRDFSQQGALQSDARWLAESTAKALTERLLGRPFVVRSLETKPYRRTPKPPFMTSTLQQEGGRKLKMSAQQVMRIAQGLYERGYITYMRTDSTTLSETAIAASRAQVSALFGDQFLPQSPRLYTKKVKNAQEAHEAIRPAGEAFRTPAELAAELQSAELKLYDLIWKRTLASQMTDAEGESVSLKLEADTGSERCEFSASGRTIRFPGFLRAYVEGTDDPEAALDDQETPLPQLAEGETVPVAAVEAKNHLTTPPSRYTEASLVEKLEELGIGRPSTYASIIRSLEAKYIWKKGQALIPNWDAFAVVALMERHFDELIDYAFTAEMNDDLDEIADGEREKLAFLKEFYFGDKKHQGLEKQVAKNIADIDAAEINSIPIGKDPAGIDIIVKPGKYGPYVKRGEDTASVPESLAPDEVTVERALSLLAAPKGDTPIGVDPHTGKPVFVKQGRFGPYVQLGQSPPRDGAKKRSRSAAAEAEVKSEVKTQSLFRSMKPEEVTLERALELLSLPRTLGQAPDGDTVTAQNGRFGPYLRKGSETRNLGLDQEHRLLTISLPEALEVFKQPRQFRGRGQPKPPMRTFGKDPVSEREIVLKEGRFGLYVTDGETNATLRRGEDPLEISAERAQELLAERREYLASPEGQERARARAARKPPRALGRPRRAAPASAAHGKAAGAAKAAAKANEKAKATVKEKAKGKGRGAGTAPRRAATKAKPKARRGAKSA